MPQNNILLLQLIEMKEDLSAEIHDLTRKQLYQSSWNLAGTLKHKVSFFYFKISFFLMLAWFSTALLLPNVNKLVMKSIKSHKCQVISRGIIKYHELSYCIIFTFWQIFGKL